MCPHLGKGNERWLFLQDMLNCVLSVKFKAQHKNLCTFYWYTNLPCLSSQLREVRKTPPSDSVVFLLSALPDPLSGVWYLSKSVIGREKSSKRVFVLIRMARWTTPSRTHCSLSCDIKVPMMERKPGTSPMGNSFVKRKLNQELQLIASTSPVSYAGYCEHLLWSILMKPPSLFALLLENLIPWGALCSG